MINTESFESVYERLYPQLHNPCGLWKAATIAEWLDDLERAHDREIRDTAQQQYHRGFEDGRRSMDAEHRAIATRLRALPLDGDVNCNLSDMALAIWHDDFRWSKDGCRALRDKLIDLMGGVSDDACGAGRGRTTADCDGDCGLQREEVSDGRVADDCGVDTGCGDGGGDIHMAGLVAYDVLWNERREAIAGLRDCNLGYTLERDNVAELFSIFGTNLYDTSTTTAEKFEVVRDRLIHLLGGDKPSGIDVLREMDAVTRYNGESKIEQLIELIFKDDQIKKLQAKLNAIRGVLDAEP